MKTLRLTKLESAAYAAGERCFWRVMKPQPRHGRKCDGSIISPDYFVWESDGDTIPITESCMYRIIPRCPYGTPDDRIEVIHSTCPGCTHATITRITVTQRGGKWGWLVEVGA